MASFPRDHWQGVFYILNYYSTSHSSAPCELANPSSGNLVLSTRSACMLHMSMWRPRHKRCKALSSHPNSTFGHSNIFFLWWTTIVMIHLKGGRLQRSDRIDIQLPTHAVPFVPGVLLIRIQRNPEVLHFSIFAAFVGGFGFVARKSPWLHSNLEILSLRVDGSLPPFYLRQSSYALLVDLDIGRFEKLA